MKKFHLTLSALIVVLLASLFACRKFDIENDLKGQEWNPALALPLLYTTVDVYDILKQADQQDLVVINENTGLLASSYRGELGSLSPQDIVQLPDQNASYTISIPGTVVPISGSVTHSSSNVESFSTPNAAEITRILFESGNLNININTSFTGGVEIIMHIPSLTRNGVEYRDTLNPSNALNIDLSAYTLDLSKGTQGFNELVFNAQSRLSASAGTVIPNPTVSVNFSLSNLRFEEVLGDFKQQVVSADRDSILLKLFGNLEDVGSLQFSNPQIFLHAENSLGFPIRVDMQNIYSYNNISGDTFKLFIDPNEAFFDIAYPSLGQKGTALNSTKTINTDNSTIGRIVSPTPKYLISDISALSNATGAPAQNFITKDSYLKIETELELPLEGRIQNFNVRDTFPYEFSENIEEIDSILVRSNITNGFPLDAWMQVYFTDANYRVLDSLFPSIDERIMLSGDLNSKGRVEKANQKITDIVFSQSRVGNITNAKHVLLAARLKTTNNGNETVKIFDEYQISLNIGMMVFGAVKIGEE